MYRIRNKKSFKAKALVFVAFVLISLSLLVNAGIAFCNTNGITTGANEMSAYTSAASDDKAQLSKAGAVVDTLNRKIFEKVSGTSDSLVANTTDGAIAKNNSRVLQQMIDDIHAAGGGTVELPAGIYYFAPVQSVIPPDPVNSAWYVVKCRDNVTVVGAGENETVLCPVNDSDLPTDMFYFNDLQEGQSNYLANAHFSNFTIDSHFAHNNGTYNARGKGFFINLFRDCTWDNVTVKNTDGTGFGMDCPINCRVSNCTAMFCGKWDGVDGGDIGSSGFGIGTGYSNDESIIIENCKALSNRRFGFFFEHQKRFSPLYTATTADGFSVFDCQAANNKYDFGGEMADNVAYYDCVSQTIKSDVAKTKMNPLSVEHLAGFFFTLDCVRCETVNCSEI